MSETAHTAMTEDRLAAIKKGMRSPARRWIDVLGAAEDLLVEVDRLRTRLGEQEQALQWELRRSIEALPERLQSVFDAPPGTLDFCGSSDEAVIEGIRLLAKETRLALSLLVHLLDEWRTLGSVASGGYGGTLVQRTDTALAPFRAALSQAEPAGQ